jgi:hypothetical protein
MPMMKEIPMPDLFTVRQFAERQPAFSEPSLRWMIFCARSSDPEAAGAGMEEGGAICRVGRRVLINESRFFAWLDAKNHAPR